MNKKSLDKLTLFLTGIEQRIIDNSEFFKKITVEFKSGTKVFCAKLLQENGKIIMNINGTKEVLEINWLSLRVSNYAKNYDGLIFTYEERGTTIVIEANDKNVSMKNRETSNKEETLKLQHEIIQSSQREYYIKVGQADELLTEIGVLGNNGKIKNDMIRKYNQIDHFVELIDHLIKGILDQKNSITILDCACGKSYLTFVLNYYIKEVLKKPCHFVGLDYSRTVIEASKKMADNLGYHNMEFKVTDIKSYRSDRKIDMVISLHACNTATDEAMALGVNNDVEAMVMVPCCQQEILNQYSYSPFEQILKHGILKARMADVLTDGIRALLLEAMGYQVSIVEYVSPIDTPKNLMLRAIKIGNVNKKLIEEYKVLKNLLDINPTLEGLVFKNT